MPRAAFSVVAIVGAAVFVSAQFSDGPLGVFDWLHRTGIDANRALHHLLSMPAALALCVAYAALLGVFLVRGRNFDRG